MKNGYYGKVLSDYSSSTYSFSKIYNTLKICSLVDLVYLQAMPNKTEQIQMRKD